MRVLIAAIGATLLTISSVLYAGGPSFPGLPDLLGDPHVLGPEMTAEELHKQKVNREQLEEFAKQLKAWWWAKHNPKPMPYIEFKGKKVKMPKKFLVAYMKAKDKDQLKTGWIKIEKSLKSGDFL